MLNFVTKKHHNRNETIAHTRQHRITTRHSRTQSHAKARDGINIGQHPAAVAHRVGQNDCIHDSNAASARQAVGRGQGRGNCSVARAGDADLPGSARNSHRLQDGGTLWWSPHADEKNSLTPAPDIIVATPGRLLDHINRKHVDLYTTKVLVLDEYDKSLELGFHDEMRKIMRTMPNLSRIILTSATRLVDMPDFLKMSSPEVIDFLEQGQKPRERTAIVEVESPARDKIDTLIDLLKSLNNGKVIIFVNHRESAVRVFDHLKKSGLPVGLYHGALDQPDREKAIDLLNNGTTPILVSTDLGARGLDIDSVHSIIHYHLPLTEETWTHRNGRTARVDASGTVYVITSEADNLPEYITFDRSYSPTGSSTDPIKTSTATIYFNAGKKEKISRGDIAGFLIKQGGMKPESIGRIIVKDHSALAAVPADEAATLLSRIASEKLKGKRVRTSLLR